MQNRKAKKGKLQLLSFPSNIKVETDVMNLKNLFQNFNPSKFVVFSCLFIFVILFALRLDGSIEWSYWFVFFPIWLWNTLAFLGAIVGCVVWTHNPQYRSETGSLTQFKAMILTCGEHVVLLVFEVLVVVKLESDQSTWLLHFVPLFALSVFCIGTCIWSVKNDRSCELELFCSVNILQFIFIALRLDKVITWSWLIVFIPLWVVMCIALVGLLYVIAVAIMLLRSPNIMRQQRRGNMSTAFGYTFFVIPLLVFEILLANRLDEVNRLSYIGVAVPLLMCLLSLVFLSFGVRGGNYWWFGIHKDFCQFLLNACPCLQEYGNISYNVQCNDQDSRQTNTTQPAGQANQSWHSQRDARVKTKDLTSSLVPIMSIDMPD